MTPANEHNHNATAMTVLRGRNTQVHQRGSKILVIGTVKEAEDMRARYRASDRFTPRELLVSALIITGVILLAASQMDAIIARGLV